MFPSGYIDIENVVYTCSVKKVSLEKEGNPTMHNTGKPWRLTAKWSKPVTGEIVKIPLIWGS